MWLSCPNSVLASHGLSEGDTTAADLGTDKHELMTMLLKNTSFAYRCLGFRLGKGNIVTQEMVEEVSKVIDFVEDKIFSYKVNGCLTRLLVDKKVSLQGIIPQTGGTLDIAIVATDSRGAVILDVIDAKFGRVKVEAKDNPQLMLYACGLMLEYPEASIVNLTIAQPLYGFSSQSYEPSDIRKWIKEIAAPAAKKALGIYKNKVLKLKNYKVSEKGCKWCPAKALCPAIDKYVADAFEEGKDTGSLSIESLADKFSKLNIIEGWIKDVRSRARVELMSGNEIPGLKLVKGRKGNRVWSDEEELMKVISEDRKLWSLVDTRTKFVPPGKALEMLKHDKEAVGKLEKLIFTPPASQIVVADTGEDEIDQGA
jgi:hypothetical protein